MDISAPVILNSTAISTNSIPSSSSSNIPINNEVTTNTSTLPSTTTSSSSSSSNNTTNNTNTIVSSKYNTMSNNTNIPPLTPEGIQSILYRIVREPLNPEIVELFRLWLIKLPDPFIALQAYNLLLDNFVNQSIAAKGPPSTMSKAKEATLSFMSKVTGNNRDSYADYPDIRLSHILLPFGPEHAHGERIPAPGAAASRPPPPVSLPSLTNNTINNSSSSSTTTSNFPLAPSINNLNLLPCPANTTLTCGLTLTNRGKPKAIVSVRPLQSFIQGDACLVSVEPATVVLDKGKSTVVHITLRLLRPCITNDAFIVIEVAGGNRILVLARAYCERTVFGMRLQDVPTTSNAGYDNIPVPLALLGDRLISDGGNTLKMEGIFRVAPSNEEKNLIRKTLNDGTFTLTYPVVSGIAIAHMIKVFLRELPQPLFSAIPTETLLNAMNEEDCISLIGWLTPPSSIIFAWLVDLLMEVIKYEQYNKMGAKNLAICTGPNLFVTDESVNPMEALMTSQKAVNALYQIINARALGEQNNRDIFSEYLGLAVRKRQINNNHHQQQQQHNQNSSSLGLSNGPPNNENAINIAMDETNTNSLLSSSVGSKEDSALNLSLPARSSINGSNRGGIRLTTSNNLLPITAEDNTIENKDNPVMMI